MLRHLAWMILGLPSAVFAQVQDSTTDSEILEPASISISSRPVAVSGATQQIRIISAQTIAEMGAQNVSDVLQNQTGILLSQDAQLGTGVTLQGLSGQSVKILINGAPMGGRLNGNIDISQIPTHQIQQIEIIEGPMSVLYGSDAIAGVINIITKKAFIQKPNTQLKSYVDATNNTNFDLSFSLPVRKNYSGLQINAGRHFFGGMDFDTFTRMFDWKPKTKTFGGFTYNTNIGNASHLLRGNHFRESMLDRSNAEYNLITVTGYNNRFITQRNEISLFSTGKFSIGNSSITAKFNNSWSGYNRTNSIVRRNLVTGNETPSFIGETDTTNNHIFNARGFFETQHKNGNMLFGYDANHEILETGRIGAARNITDVGLFAQANIESFKHWQIQPSLRANFNSRFGEPILTNTPKLRITPIMPSLQLKYSAGKKSKNIWRASYAKGYRSPTLKELYFLFVDINHNVRGNEKLQAEIAHNGMISHRAVIDCSNENVHFLVHTTERVFYNQINQQIQLALIDANTQLYQYINVGRMNSGGAGVDIESNFRIKNSHKRLHYTFNAGADYIQNNNQLNDSSDWVGFNTVQGKANIKINSLNANQSIQIFSRMSGKTQGFLANGKTYEILPYTLFDINVAKQIQPWGYHYPIQLQLGCKNIFNITQRNGAQTGGIHGSNGVLNVSPGRAFFASITFNIQ